MDNQNITQMEFDLDSTLEENATDDGYKTWQNSQQQIYARIADVWHLPLHRKVRVKLKWRPDELNGVLTLREIPEIMSTKFPLKLRVDFTDFDSSEIEYCKLIS
ncbi:MAG: hypothetical protein WC071_13710 [Victivallaceae bacterium]